MVQIRDMGKMPECVEGIWRGVGLIVMGPVVATSVGEQTVRWDEVRFASRGLHGCSVVTDTGLGRTDLPLYRISVNHGAFVQCSPSGPVQFIRMHENPVGGAVIGG